MTRHHMLTVRLVTLCGCSQFVVVPGPLPESIEMPIAAEVGDDDPVRVHSRTFRLQVPSDTAVEADYHEVYDPR